MSSGSLVVDMPAWRRSSLRRGSHAGDVRGIVVRRGRVKASMRHEEDNVKERNHGETVVSLGHGELTVRRGDSHGDGDGNGR